MKAVRVVGLTVVSVAIAIMVAQNLDQSVAVIILAQAGPTLPLGILLLVCFGAGLIIGSVFWFMQGLIRGRSPRTRERRPEPPPVPLAAPIRPDREPAPYSGGQSEDYRWDDRETVQDDEPDWR